MKGQSILLISHGPFERESLEGISYAIEAQLKLPVCIDEGRLELSDFYDPSRRQYDGNRLLKEIEAIESSSYIKKMGLFRIDLFIPILTYIFGQANLAGSAGIASLYRLRNEQYGLKKNNELLQNRFQKVVIHELGHTFGLIHCHKPGCVMRASTYVEDIDQKNESFCSGCREAMKTHQD